MNTCLVPGCSKVVASRGLCVAHYQTARNLVRGGKTSWEKLTAAGKAVGRVRSDSSTAFFLAGPEAAR